MSSKKTVDAGDIQRESNTEWMPQFVIPSTEAGDPLSLQSVAFSSHKQMTSVFEDEGFSKAGRSQCDVMRPTSIH